MMIHRSPRRCSRVSWSCRPRRPCRDSAAFCDVAPPWSQATQVKFMAVYPLPWHIQTSAIYQNSSGIPVTASYVATNAEILPSLGRNLGSCRGAATCNGNLTVELIPPNSVFEPRLQQVDLRFSRIFQFGTRKLRGRPGHLQPPEREQRPQHEHDLQPSRRGLAGRDADSRRTAREARFPGGVLKRGETDAESS